MTIDIDNVGDDVEASAKRLLSGGYMAANEYNEEDHDDPDMAQLIKDQISAARAIGNLSILVRRLSCALRKASPDHDLPNKADDYIHRKGLGGSILR